MKSGIFKIKKYFFITIVTMVIFYLTNSVCYANANDNKAIINFKSGSDVSKIIMNDALLNVDNKAGIITFKETGGSYKWPGITFNISNIQDLRQYTYFFTNIKNNNHKPLRIYFAIYDQEGHYYSSVITLGGDQNRLWYVVPRRAEFSMTGKTSPLLFGMNAVPTWAVGQDSKSLPLLSMEKVNQIKIFVVRSEGQEDACFSIGNIQAGGTYSYEKAPDTLFPFVDSYGQYKFQEWPGKIHSIDELKQCYATEEKQLSSLLIPSDWDEYGGWSKGPALKATGYFRTALYNGKWYFVTPNGHLFFSVGPTCMNNMECTPVDNRQLWFDALPTADSYLGDCYTKAAGTSTGYYANKNPLSYNFHEANLKVKYGPDWETKYTDTLFKRLPRWGMNTIGWGGAPEICSRSQLPYVVEISNNGQYGKQIAGVDVFNSDFEANLRERMRKEINRLNIKADDPMCIGYYIDGELYWGDEKSLALACLSSTPINSTKQVFIGEMQAKYKTIEKLNSNWNSKYKSWNDLLNSRDIPKTTTAMDVDLRTFNKEIVKQYFSTCCKVVNNLAPHHLYLGGLFDSSAYDSVVEIAQKYCDVVSFNVYAFSPRANARLASVTDKPVIIGEFDFGATDRGGFGSGLVPVKDQNDRAQAYKDYVTICLKDASIVGCHWFQFVDEPLTGSTWTQANDAIGFVDIADTPYSEMTKASREIGLNLYQIRNN